MLDRIRHLLSPPSFDDEDQTRAAGLLHIITLAIAAILVIYVITALALTQERRGLLYAAIITALAIAVNRVSWRGYTRGASGALAAALWLILTIPLIQQGIYHSSFTGYLFPILIAGLLISRRASFVFATLSAVTGLVVLLTREAQVTQDAALRRATHATYFYVLAVLFALATASIEKALERARRSECDLTERNRELEHEIAERQRVEEAYRTLVEHSAQGLVIFQDGRVVFANARMCEMLGYSSDELLSLDDPVSTLVHSEDESRALDAMALTLAGEAGGPNLEYRVIHRQGQEIWLESFGTQIVYQGGPAFQFATIDITERKQTEEALKRSEERFYKAFHSNPVAITLSTLGEGRFVDVNESCVRLLGYSREELIGHTAVELQLWDSREERDSMIRDLHQAGTIRQMAADLRTKSGVICPGLLSVDVIELDGQPHLLGMIQDISDMKQAERQALELALARAREASLRDFLGTISHDLKTPLSVINTSLYLLERIADPGRQQERIDTIRAQAKLLERYIEDILTISRLDHTPMLALKPVDLNHLLRNIVERLRPSMEQKHLTTTLELSPDVAAVLGDEDELDRVLVNLIENAVRYTPDGGSIHVRTRPEGGWAVAEIVDSGIGIGEADLPHIFERFYRAEAAKTLERRGTGLGLAIVKKIVELHEGSIEAHSVAGKGTTFSVRLPVG